MAKVVIIYSSTDGHTRKICDRLKQVVEAPGNEVTVVPVSNVDAVELISFDKIIVGASIRYGRHSKNIYKFIKENQQVLESRPNAFFSVNVVARKPEKAMPETNPYLRKFLSQISWNPGKLAVFAGKIEYRKYSFLDRSIIRLIMWITKGPTDPTSNIEFTDWNKVAEFGQVINEM